MITTLVTINDYAKPFPVNARDLYDALDVGRDFSTWMAHQIQKFQFIEGFDFSPNRGESTGGRPGINYFLTLRMAKHIAMVSNTDTGSRVRDQFIAVENAWNTPEMVMLRGLQASQQIIARQSAEIAALADDAQVARTISTAIGLKTITEVGKISGIGPRKIFDLLEDRGILYRIRGSWVPKQEHINSGYFAVKERTYPGTSGAPHLTTQTLVTGKGEVWLTKQLMPRTGLQTIGGAV